MSGILLGFEIPTGVRVEVPIDGHLAWFGQTQLSGKTTALEALVYRGGFKAIAFITKRGEGSFLTAKDIPPYFSEPTNDAEQPLWRWVKSILEASQQRRMNFEESWVIRACEEPRQAETLADVHSNIKALLSGEHRVELPGRKRKGRKNNGDTKWFRKPVTGIHASVYTSLKAYFDIVMPQLARLPYTNKLELRPGLNVMDLRDYSIEMQGLVIRSVMEYVYLHERSVRVIVPEAQDFVPQGKNGPVKMACENLVRKGAADKNFMWLDSQDMAAVDKVMLRQVSILGLGVQGQTHEINRSIDALFGEVKLRAADIGRLRVGEFYVRVPGGVFKKVYVQPAWMDSELHAQAIARGEEPVSSAKPMLRAFEKEKKADANLGTDRSDTPETETLVAEIREESMWEEKYRTLLKGHEELSADYHKVVAAHDALAAEVARLRQSSQTPTPSGAEQRGHSGSGKTTSAPVSANGHGPALLESLDSIYTYVRDRAISDQIVLTLIAKKAKPEIEISIERQTCTIDGDTLRGRLALLITKKFFDAPRNGNMTFTELKRLGFGTAKPNVYRELDKLAEMGFLTAEESGYQAVPEMKIHIHEAKA